MRTTIRKTKIFTLIGLLFLIQNAFGQTSVLTQHNDLNRSGWNNNETILTTKNVSPGQFGKLFSREVDDQIYAQLLIKSNVSIPDKGIKNVVFVATVNNSVYAFDADSKEETAPYWQVNLTPSGSRAVRNTDMTGACYGNYQDFSGNIGIVGTPVIDSTSGTLYVVARSTSSSTGFQQYLHALDITTGKEKPNSPKLITAQVPGTGSGSENGIITFDPLKQNQRSGLLLLNGNVYITYASHCDWGPYHGWILGYDKNSLNQTVVYNDTKNGYNGGIWMSGGAPAADEEGNIYVSVGNGSVGEEGTADTVNRSESTLKLVPANNTLKLASYFTPYTYETLEDGDLDFGSTQLLLVPETNIAMTGCKDGLLYIVDRDNMGGFHSDRNNILQSINLGSNARLHSSLTYYKGKQKEYVYVWSENSALKAFPFNRTTNTFDVDHVISSGTQGPVGNSGAFTSVSSNGSIDSTAVLWATFAVSGDANLSTRPGILYAFSATDVTKQLWNSSIESDDKVGNYAKFNCPTIANGKVYLATFSNQFHVYGLTGNKADTCNSFDVALNKTGVASSVEENTTNFASAAFDGDPNTRWSSTIGLDSQYIYVDLQERYDLCRVILKWEAGLGRDFTIDVSDDAKNWTTIKTITDNISFTNSISLKGTGRYVRMNGTLKGSINGWSLWSFEVYGTPSTESNCKVPTSLSASNIHETSATLHWSAEGVTKFNIQYKQATSPDWISVTSDNDSITLTNLDPGHDYFFKVQSVCSETQKSAFSDPASFSQFADTVSCSPLPTRWTTQDIGNTSITGSACYLNGTFTLKGSGTDIGGNADAFRFAYQTLVGDGEYIARIVSLDNTSSSNKCGIMIRETQSANSKYAFIGLTSENGLIFQTRSTTSGSAVTVQTTEKNIAAPYWVKLIKIGSNYSAYISSDGINWKPLGSSVDAKFGTGSAVYSGLAITSNDNSKLATGIVDHYSYSSGVLPITLQSFTASINLNNTVDLKWITTLEMNSSYFVIERQSGDNQYIVIDTVRAVNNGSFSTTYNAKDNSPLNGTNIYRLKMIDINGEYRYSALVSVNVSNSKVPTIYPNPAKTVLHISKGTEFVKQVTIYDFLGKVILRKSYSVDNNLILLPISGLVRGTYIIEIATPENIYRDKLIKQ